MPVMYSLLPVFEFGSDIFIEGIFNGPKLKAEVSLIVSEPDEILRVRLFDVHE
jgi:hypothetical protein